MSKTAFISGHLKISSEEFNQHYLPKLEEARLRGDNFVVGDAIGADYQAQVYLFLNNYDKVVVYHMFTAPRCNAGKFPTKGGYKNDDDRDAAMTDASDYDIAWVRPGKEKSGTAKNIQRRNK